MRFTLSTIALLILLMHCRKASVFSLSHSNQNKIIALQPFEAYDKKILNSIQLRLSKLFKTRVVILKERRLPELFSHPYSDGYSADSLLHFLLEFRNDTIVEMVGITDAKIYTLKEHLPSNVNRSTVSYPHTIRGLAYLNRNVSVVSSYSLAATDQQLFENRIYKAIVHEIGHNLRLDHCKNDTCVMSANTGDIKVLDKTAGEYCNECRKKLK